jgi:hypothetical protein
MEATITAASPAKPDAAILDAWERHTVARATYEALRSSEKPGEEYTPAELAQWAIIDATEDAIRRDTASTTQGVEVQLWVALGHMLMKREECEAALRGDLAYLEQRDLELDWTERLILSAIRSLRAMGGAA